MNFGLDNFNFNFLNTLQSFSPLNFQDEEEENIFENGLLQATLPQTFEQKWGEKPEGKGGVEELGFQFTSETLGLQEKQKLIPNLQSNFDLGCGDSFTVQRYKSQTVSFYGTDCVWDIANNSLGKEHTQKQQLSQGEEGIIKNGNENEKENETDGELSSQPQILMFPTYTTIDEEEENELNFGFTNFIENSEQAEENEINYLNHELFQKEFDLYPLKNNLIGSTTVKNDRKRQYSQTTKIGGEQEHEHEHDQEQEQNQKQNDHTNLDQLSTNNLLDETPSKSKTGNSTVYAREIDWQRKTFKIKKIGTKVLILKRKRKPRSQRLYTSRYGKRVLERWFLRHLNDKGGPYPTKRQRKTLSRRADIPQLQVQRWFGQRRRVQRIRWENEEAPKPNWIDQDLLIN
ncbi:tgfb-induced factor homeobox 2-like [Anaeramoeba flamelloides]|uniref:Tgfb-induced factor homeobox 2-like n=1 Tax=Anaeramoeba flamelloides TaxID=1746091 RepID=A0ABQ8YJQ4_9EUKA|nr:tgfb-induced factor homeobox 2-like [Anaeramoeba flamelloides]